MTKEQRDLLWNDVYVRMIVALRNSKVPLADEDFVADPKGDYWKSHGEWIDGVDLTAEEAHRMVTTTEHQVARAAAVWAAAAVYRAQLDEQARTLRPPTKSSPPTNEFKHVPKDMT